MKLVETSLNGISTELKNSNKKDCCNGDLHDDVWIKMPWNSHDTGKNNQERT
jgi:hypothetical protein